MPAPEVRHQYQAAVLWSRSGIDAYGQPTVGAPVEIRVQWNDVQTEAQDTDGSTITLDATVFASQTISVGSRMWLGTLEEWYASGSAGVDQELMTVKTFNSVRDIRNRARTYQAGLMKYRDA